MDWAQIKTWPNAEFSRIVAGPVHRWHIQEAGKGATILMLHGAGGSTHSLRALFRILSDSHHVIALDLPGHGFTQLGGQQRSGLEAMTSDIVALCHSQDWRPGIIVGHSAGGAIALSLSEKVQTPLGARPLIVGLNSALQEFDGMAGLLFPVMAKMLAALPFSASLFSSTAAKQNRVQALIDATGSTLDEEGVDLYRRLVADKTHVNGTLKMMAQWDLRPLINALGSLSTETVFVVGTNDKTVPPQISEKAAMRMPNARVLSLNGLGHLAHEEAPGAVASLIQEASETALSTGR